MERPHSPFASSIAETVTSVPTSDVTDIRATIVPVKAAPSSATHRLSRLPPAVHAAAHTFSSQQLRFFRNMSRKEKRFLIAQLRDPRVDEHTFFTELGLSANEMALYLFAVEPVRRRVKSKHK